MTASLTEPLQLSAVPGPKVAAWPIGSRWPETGSRDAERAQGKACEINAKLASHGSRAAPTRML